MNNTAPNPMFAKFDQVLGKTTPTTVTGPVSSRADEIRNLAKSSQPQQDPNQINVGGQKIVGGYAGNVVKNLGETFSQGGKNVASDIQNTGNLAEQAGNTPLAKAASIGATAGHIAGDIAGTAGGIIGSFVSPLVHDSIKSKIGDVSNYVSSKIDSIPGMTPDIKKGLGDLFNTLTLEGGKKLPEAAVEAKNIISDVGNIAKPIADKAGDIGNTLKDKIVAPSTLDENVGKVLQGKTKDIESGKSGLASIDTSKVKTYSDLKNTADSEISKSAKIQDETLLKDPTLRKIDSFNKTVGTGESSTNINYVKEALGNLKELYTSTADAKGEAGINGLISKAGKGGITVKEVNDLARTYGSEFSSKAFGKTGEALTSVNATRFENIRSGLKNTARDLLPDDASKALDDKMTNLYTVRDLSSKMEEKVNTLTQRLQKPNIMQKIGGVIGRGARITGVGDLASKLLGMDKIPGAKTLDAVELQDKLSKNLGRINSALQKSDAGFVKDIKEIIQSENSPATNSTAKNTTNANMPKITTFALKSQTGKSLQSAFQKYQTIPNKQGGFVSIGGRTFREIPEATKREMIQAIDYLRIGKSVAGIEDTISKLAHKYNISEDLSSQNISKKFENLIENTKTK